jgi:hypothetical protein
VGLLCNAYGIRVATGQIEYYIAAHEKNDDLSAILAIVYPQADAEYALLEGTRPVKLR